MISKANKPDCQALTAIQHGICGISIAGSRADRDRICLVRVSSSELVGFQDSIRTIQMRWFSSSVVGVDDAVPETGRCLDKPPMVLCSYFHKVRPLNHEPVI